MPKESPSISPAPSEELQFLYRLRDDLRKAWNDYSWESCYDPLALVYERIQALEMKEWGI